MQKKILPFLIAAVFFTACNNASNSEKQDPSTAAAPASVDTSTQTAAVPDMHNSENSVDWAGVYEGTLPCADCEGIKTTINLNDDKTFSKKDEYLGKKGQTFNEKGNFSWSADGSTITLNAPDEKYVYKVTEGSIIMLDADGKEVTGELAKNYILLKK